MSLKSRILVYIQFGSFLFFALAGNLFGSGVFLALQLTGLIIGLWGILAMKMGNFNIQPEVKKQANMVSRGPYKIIRNPMYSGLILFFGVSVLANFNPLRFIVFIVLTTVLILKIDMEENFLTQKFGNKYRSYKKRTYKLLPFIY